MLTLNSSSSNVVRQGSAKHAEIELEVGNDLIIRKKGKGKNVYYLNDQEYKAFGSEVPSKIKSALNVTEENIQSQLEPHFWINLSPGQLAKELNRIVDLSVIDNAMKNINDQIKEKEYEVKIGRQRVKDLETEKEELAWFVEFEKESDSLIKKGNLLAATSDKINSLASSIAECEKLQSSRLIASNAILDGLKAKQTATDLLRIQKRAEYLKKSIKSIEKIKKPLEIPKIENLETIFNTGKNLIKQIGELEEVMATIRMRIKIDKGMNEEINQLKKTISSMQKVCPTCKRPM